jgi:hypothetical protein
LSLAAVPIDWTLSRIAWLILHLGPAGAGRAIGPLSFWFVWEWITDIYFGLKPIRPGALLKYTIRCYHGPPVELEDGTTVSDGDRIMELHFDNKALLRHMTAVGGPQGQRVWGWLLAKWAADDVSYLAQPGRLDPEIRALHGVSLLGSGFRRVGFEARQLPKNRRNDLTRFFMLGLLAIYSPDGRRRLELTGSHTYPTEVWFGRRALERRYQKTPEKEGKNGSPGSHFALHSGGHDHHSGESQNPKNQTGENGSLRGGRDQQDETGPHL